MSKLMCKLSGHKWQGCLCTRCGETREEGHAWVGMRCQECFTSHLREQKCKTILNAYLPTGACRRTKRPDRLARELGDGCYQICFRCKQDRIVPHRMSAVEGSCHQVCDACGYQSEPQHTWNGCTCTVCGETREEAHKWIKRGCIETCSICGKKKEHHQDRVIGKEETYGTGTCPTFYYSDKNACTYCNSPEACRKYPKKTVTVYRCKVCGRIKRG